MKIEDLPERYRDQVRAQMGGRPGLDQTASRMEEPKRRRQPNKTEMQYRREVIDRIPGVQHVAYEPMTFRMANGHRYTPDWVYVIDGHVHCVEVKGSYRLQSHQRARLAFDQAAVEFPHLAWIWAELGMHGDWKQTHAGRGGAA